MTLLNWLSVGEADAAAASSSFVKGDSHVVGAATEMTVVRSTTSRSLCASLSTCGVVATPLCLCASLSAGSSGGVMVGDGPLGLAPEMSGASQ